MIPLPSDFSDSRGVIAAVRRMALWDRLYRKIARHVRIAATAKATIATAASTVASESRDDDDTLVGLAVGVALGLDVGDPVGDPVGRTVGAVGATDAVGLLIGDAVGC
jgi:hypothetical protein